MSLRHIRWGQIWEHSELLLVDVPFSLGMETCDGLRISATSYKVIATEQMQTFSPSSDAQPAVPNWVSKGGERARTKVTGGLELELHAPPAHPVFPQVTGLYYWCPGCPSPVPRAQDHRTGETRSWSPIMKVVWGYGSEEKYKNKDVFQELPPHECYIQQESQSWRREMWEQDQ